MYRIKNTAEDRTKHLLHRTAAKFELEPTLGGIRIRLGSFLDITDEHYDRVRPIVDEWVKKGMVEVIDLDSSRGDRLSKWKSMEPYVKAATEQEKDEEDSKQEIADLTAAAIKEELNRPSTISQILPAVPVQEIEVPPEPTVIVEPEPAPVVEPEPTVIVIPPVIQAPPPPPVSNKPPAQDPNKNKKLR